MGKVLRKLDYEILGRIMTQQIVQNDFKILKLINENKNIGTVELAGIVGLAPKNLIARIKKYITLELITKKSIPAKPKGRQRIFTLTAKGDKVLELSKSIF